MQGITDEQYISFARLTPEPSKARGRRRGRAVPSSWLHNQRQQSPDIVATDRGEACCAPEALAATMRVTTPGQPGGDT